MKHKPHLMPISVREMRASLASLAVRLGRTERWEEVSTADISEALELLGIFAGLKQMRQDNAKNATKEMIQNLSQQMQGKTGE
jgi:hypothetical protein